MNYEAFFNRKPADVAKDLLGRMIIRFNPKGALGLEIVETGAYFGGEENVARVGMFYDPGKIFLMEHRGHRMLNIATGGNGPSCVEIRAVRDLTKKISGSATITNFFQIPAELDNLLIGDKSGVYISEEKFRTGKMHTQKGSADNCVGIYTFD